jgi:transcriptional regulator with XRE-family HTH domain
MTIAICALAHGCGKPRFSTMDSINLTDLHVGAKLRARRIELGISDEKLARVLRVSTQQVIAWELGVTSIGPSWLSKIAKILDIDSMYFFMEADPASPGLQ